MGSTVHPNEWKPKETAGNSTQVGMPFLSTAPAMQMLPAPLVTAASFSGCLIEACRFSGMEDKQLADRIHVSTGYFSKFIRGVGQQWAKRLVAFMRHSHSLAPLQWIAVQMGCDVTLRDARAAEVAALKSRLMELEHAA